MSRPVATYRKAVTAAATSLLGALGVTYLGGITEEELVGACIAGALAGLATYRVTNADPTGEHQDESVTPPG